MQRKNMKPAQAMAENAWEEVTLNSDWMKLWHNILGPIRNKKVWHQRLEVSNQPQHPQAMVVVSRHAGVGDLNFDQLITISYFAFGGLNVTKGSRWVETIIVRYVFQLSWRSNLIVSAFFIMDMNVVPSCLADFHSYLLTQDLQPCDCRPNCLTTQKPNQNGANQLFNKSMSVLLNKKSRLSLSYQVIYSLSGFCLSMLVCIPLRLFVWLYTSDVAAWNLWGNTIYTDVPFYLTHQAFFEGLKNPKEKFTSK